MRFTSIREAYDNIMEHPMMRDVTLEKVVRYAVEFLRVLNMPRTKMEKTAVLEVRDYRAARYTARWPSMTSSCRTTPLPWTARDCR